MDKDFYKLVTQKLAEKLGCEPQNIYIVWQCKTLQNIKGLFSSDVEAANGMYYEATYNGNKGELYLDSYKKLENEVIKVKF
ncbi:hypothetical protein BUI56_12080 [Lactococcus lactis subsp. lactis]|uniref:DUF6275 family protein n=1 Tax=Lactococcus lactis TaxID=1358 RepID=UPI000200D26D|nr:DUF6275 family protein [Lactococcus lactis]ADZ63654.1 conserved hypothetical protein [Lactococcus lactis subsp. lactis CV56]KAF0951144.1 hypothetical protein BUI56_12080 [Lactococcus lactis subsp. lactis]MDH5115354.1 DUF6275 family protein [Lactococcus lactis]MDM7656387.1 DUF6275 family protein [Lactococcus lactis]QQB11792.1 hypothetical protein I6I21_00750 [Lactococcus lactis]